MKTLDDVKADMSTLYEELRKGEVEIKQADALANVAGKYLKADALVHARDQLGFAREVFEAKLGANTIKQIDHA